MNFEQLRSAIRGIQASYEAINRDRLVSEVPVDPVVRNGLTSLIGLRD